jgi:ribosomal-protein-alanine N-acetyltransferase
MLIGKTVSLRHPSVEDAELLARWTNDPEYFGPFFNPFTTTRASVEHSIASPQGVDAEAFIITHRETGEPIGRIGYVYPYVPQWSHLLRGLEIWYNVHPQARRQGIGSQAACVLVNHLFNSRPIERIQATVLVGNEGSCGVCENAGLQRDGIFRKVFFLRGRYLDAHLYSIVRDDWKDEESYRRGRADF